MWRKILQVSERLVNLLSLVLLAFVSLAVYKSQVVAYESRNVERSLAEASLVPIPRWAVGSATSATAAGAEQDGTKSICMERPGKGDPVRISGLFEGNNDIAPFVHDPDASKDLPNPYALWDRVPVPAGDDWLSSLVVAVRNVSSKELVAASIDLRFPETGSGKTPDDAFIGQAMYLGQIPEHARYAADGHKVSLPVGEPINIKSGQEVRFVVAPYANEIQRAVNAKRPFATITTCRLLLSYFYFSDGTRWAPFAGFQTPDSSLPGKYSSQR